MVLVATCNGRARQRSYRRCVALPCLIVDDDRGFLVAARAVLEQQEFAIVGVASTSAEATRSVAQRRSDVALLDIDLGENGRPPPSRSRAM
jgi:DNA-binding response OmpR family regulator